MDLVESYDQVTHEYDLTETMNPEDNLNIFKFDNFYEKSEKEWDEIKFEILGEENII